MTWFLCTLLILNNKLSSNGCPTLKGLATALIAGNQCSEGLGHSKAYSAGLSKAFECSIYLTLLLVQPILRGKTMPNEKKACGPEERSYLSQKRFVPKHRSCVLIMFNYCLQFICKTTNVCLDGLADNKVLWCEGTKHQCMITYRYAIICSSGFMFFFFLQKYCLGPLDALKQYSC